MDNFIIANRTDVGMQRQVNEDSMVTFDSPNGRVIVVCDGMGGQAAGDVASRLACDVIQDLLVNNTFASPMEAITRGVVAANQVILNRQASNPELEGMGSTCVMVIIKNNQVYYGWVGDSRIYYFSNGQLQQLSRDQSYVQQLVDAGQLTPEEAERHPQKNEITNALGVPNMTPPELSAVPMTPEPGAIMLLCSDGLSGMVPAATIQQVLGASNMSLQEKADQLVSLANAAGGIDNVTVQLVQFQQPVVPPPGPSAPRPAQSAAVAAAKKSNTMMKVVMSAVIAVVVILAAALFFFKKDSTKTPDAESQTTEHVEKSEKKENKTTNTKVVVKEETTVIHKQAPSKSTSKKNSSPADKIGGKKDKKKEPKTPDIQKLQDPKPTPNPDQGGGSISDQKN